jgi:hypothetical protein
MNRAEKNGRQTSTHAAPGSAFQQAAHPLSPVRAFAVSHLRNVRHVRQRASTLLVSCVTSTHPANQIARQCGARTSPCRERRLAQRPGQSHEQPGQKGKREPVTAAERIRVHRTRRRNGLRCVRVELHETEIDQLVQMGFLKSERHDHDAVENAMNIRLRRIRSRGPLVAVAQGAVTCNRTTVLQHPWWRPVSPRSPPLSLRQCASTLLSNPHFAGFLVLREG